MTVNNMATECNCCSLACVFCKIVMYSVREYFLLELCNIFLFSVGVECVAKIMSIIKSDQNSA